VPHGYRQSDSPNRQIRYEILRSDRSSRGIISLGSRHSFVLLGGSPFPLPRNWIGRRRRRGRGGGGPRPLTSNRRLAARFPVREEYPLHLGHAAWPRSRGRNAPQGSKPGRYGGSELSYIAQRILRDLRKKELPKGLVLGKPPHMPETRR
jgi:hypothetical protein